MYSVLLWWGGRWNVELDTASADVAFALFNSMCHSADAVMSVVEDETFPEGYARVMYTTAAGTELLADY